MKFLIGLAVIFAVAAVGFLCASLFVEGGALVYTSIGAGLSLVAFILALVGYVSKAVK
jgi:hypothetical protein